MASKRKFKQRLIQALTINSPKKLLLFFIVAFAISGAGVLMYRAFAGTGEIVRFSDDIYYHAGWASKELDTSGDKKNKKIWRLFTGGAVKTKYTLTATEWFNQTYYKFCIYARIKEGNKMSLTLQPTDDKFNVVEDLVPTKYVIDNSDAWKYHKHCLEHYNYHSNSSVPQSYQIEFGAILTNWGPGVADVSFISMQFNTSLLVHLFDLHNIANKATIPVLDRRYH